MHTYLRPAVRLQPRPQPRSRSCSRSRARAGNALVVAVGILTIAGAAMAVSTNRAISSLRTVGLLQSDATALGAVETVIAKHQQTVIALAEGGDPNAFAAWAQNYGVEFFGDCEVRWKVEPVRSPSNLDVANNVIVPVANPIAFISNPSPDINWEAPTTGVKDALGAVYPTSAGTPYWRTNDSVYLFRVSAEARQLDPLAKAADQADWSKPGTWRSRAQGVRYVSVNKEPLFRYVIFYAQNGPKGDLELSHGPTINIQGNVHSNGSIYLGAGAKVNAWDSVRPRDEVSGTGNGETRLGPDDWADATVYAVNDRVFYGGHSYSANLAHTAINTFEPAKWTEIKDAHIRVTGVNGLFRLAKPAMYGRFNGFPMAAPILLPAWSPPVGVVSTTDYDLGVSTPLDAFDNSDRSTILAATFAQAWINPYRIKRDSELSTRPLGTGSLTDTSRRINGNPIVGNWENVTTRGNDSRDLQRDPDRAWSVLSINPPPDGFSGYARSQVTGGRSKQLPETLASRPMETQKLFYPDGYVLNKIAKALPITASELANPALSPILGGLLPGSVPTQTTPSLQAFLTANRERGDAHDLATPLFWNPTASPPAETVLYSEVAGLADILEVPGQYIRYAIDGVGATAAYMRRLIDPDQGFIGWSITDAAGAALAQPSVSGIIIRERPVPDFKYWGITSGGVLFTDRSAGANNWIPYAYGKHKDPAVWPFTEMWVSDQGSAFATIAPNPATVTVAAVAALTAGTGAYNTIVRTSSARLSTTTATQSYSVDPTNPGYITVTAAALRGDDSTITITGTNNNASVAGGDPNGYFRDNWRLIHLKRNNVVNASLPSVDLTQASTYFQKASFQSVQARLQPDPATSALITGGAGNMQLAGLMIRPVNRAGTGVTAALDLKANGLNSRDPYVAIAISPKRGLVVQRRLVQSKALIAVAPKNQRYYTGTNDGSGTTDAILGCLTPDQAVFQQDPLTRTPVTAPGFAAGVSSYDTGIVRTPATGYNGGVPTAGGGSNFSVTLSKPQGEGTISQTFSLVKGPWSRSATWTASKSWRIFKYRARTSLGAPGYWDLVVYKGGSVLTDYFTSMTTTPNNAVWWNGWSGQPFWLMPNWTAGAPSSSGAVPAFTGNIPAYSASGASPAVFGEGFIANDRLRFSTSGFTVPGFPVNTGYSFVDGSGWYSPPNVAVAGYYRMTASSTANSTNYSYTGTWTAGTAATVFTDLGQYAAAAAFIGSGNIIAALGPNGITGSLALGVAGTPTAPSGDAADPVAPTPPADPTYPAQPPVPDYGTGDLRFAVKRDGALAYSRVIEVNSWISARGTWGAFDRFQNTSNLSGNSADRIVGTADPLNDNTYSPAIAPGTSESLRPDYWTGAALAPGLATWANMYQPSNPADGSIVPGTTGYVLQPYLNNFPASPTLWEDAQVPYWVSGVTYTAEVTATHTRASVVLYSDRFYQCIATVSGATNPSADPTHWTRADHVWLKIEKDAADNLVFWYHVGLTAPLTWHWREVSEARLRNPDNTAQDPGPGNPSSKIAIPAAWSADWVVGPCLQSGHISTTATAIFSNLAVVDTADPSGQVDKDDWEGSVDTYYDVANVGNLNGRTVDITTKYLCSQYQVFFGPLDITEDFFSYTVGGSGLATARNANERVFYNPREFWSQSAWWNEGDLSAAWAPVARTNWVWRETNTTTAPVALPANGSVATTQVEYFARTTALDIDLANWQTYLTTRTLAQAAYKWSGDTSQGTVSTDLLKDRFSGLLYAARTNRYPRHPLTVGENPFNPDLPNHSGNANAGTDLSLSDLYNNQPNPLLPTAMAAKVRDRLVATLPSNRGVLSAPIRMQEFHHAIMISNGATINWGMGSPAVFGESKTSIVTPNQLFVHKDLNNNQQSVRTVATDAATATLKYTPLAIMGDSVTLLSNNWTTVNYSQAGLATATDKVTLNTSTLSRQYGTTAAATSYRTCILTNNQPTTKYRVFQGEGAPFINTMLFNENWSGVTMNFTGSLVVLDSCRYTRGFLLDDPRDYGRSPFGLMGWHASGTWSALTGWTGGGLPDWCKNGLGQALPLAGGTNNPNSPFGAIQVYKAPSRNMTFNLDLLTEQGTPPNTPFGVTAAGVAGWSRVLR